LFSDSAINHHTIQETGRRVHGDASSTPRGVYFPTALHQAHQAGLITALYTNICGIQWWSFAAGGELKERSYAYQDWETDNQGNSHGAWDSAFASGSPAAQQELAHWRDSAIQASEKWLTENGYEPAGVERPSFQRRSDEVSSGRDRGTRPAVGYGQPQENSSRVAAAHYSSQKCDVLDASKNGTGCPARAPHKLGTGNPYD